MGRGASAARRLRYRIRRNAETNDEIHASIHSRLGVVKESQEDVYAPSVVAGPVYEYTEPSRLFSHVDDVISSTLHNANIPDHHMSSFSMDNGWGELQFPIDFVEHPDCDCDCASTMDTPYPFVCDLCEEASRNKIMNTRPIPTTDHRKKIIPEELLDYEPESVPNLPVSPGEVKGFITPCYLGAFNSREDDGVIAAPIPNDAATKQLEQRCRMSNDIDLYQLLQLYADCEFLTTSLCCSRLRRRYFHLKRLVSCRLYVEIFRIFDLRCTCSVKRGRKRKDSPTCFDDLARHLPRHLVPPQPWRRFIIAIFQSLLLSLLRHVHDGHAARAVAKWKHLL